MPNVRPILDRVWDSLRKASVVDDLAIVEYIAALLVEGKDWPFDEDQKPGKPRGHYNPDDIAVTNQLMMAATEINETDQHPDLADLFNRHILFYSSKYKGNGVYPTPRHIVDFMMNLLQIEPQHDFADLACGSGGFLVSRHYQKQISGRRIVPILLGRTVGVDIAPEWTRLAHANVLLHGIPTENVQIYTGNVLRLCRPGGELEHARFDRIALSPPLNIPVQIQIPDHELFSLMGMVYTDTDVLNSDTLLTHVMHTRLKQDGKGISIVSAKTLSRRSREAQALRNILIKGQEVQAVIELNDHGLYPLTDEQAYVLMLHKHVQQSSWFLRIENDGYIASRDLMQEPSFTPEWNDMPFIEQVVNTTEDTPEWKFGGRSKAITYLRVRMKTLVVGIIVKTQKNARIARVMYEQSYHACRLVVEVGRNDETELERVPISLPTRSVSHPSSKTVFHNGKPGQMLAISYDGRLLGVTASFKEIVDKKYDLLPATYINMHIPDEKTVERTPPDTADILEAAILDKDPASGSPAITQLPPIATLPDIEPILGAQQQAIWNAIKERYALYFTAHELTDKFARQDVIAALRLLERFGLIVCVQRNDEEDDPAPYYYRRVMSADSVHIHRPAEEISQPVKKSRNRYTNSRN